jgi:hypothetical protein
MPFLVDRPKPFVLAVLAAVVASAGCASGPGSSVQGQWEGNRPAQAYSRVLVVGLSPNLDARCRFEQVMAGRLRSESTEAIASCDVTDHQAPLTRALIEEAVSKLKIDVVLATKLVARAWDSRDGGSRDTRGSAGYKATDAGFEDVYGYYGGIYSVPVVYGEYQSNAETVVMIGQAQVESRVWSVAGPALVYSLLTKVKGAESSDEGLSLLAGAISKDLVKQGLVR